MQEIRDNTSVDPYSDLSNELMWPYLTVPTYLLELFVKFFTLSYLVEWWNLSFVSLLLSLFLKSTGENMITMILWFFTLAQPMFLFILPSKG
jgi:hypothetical protein